MPLINMQHDAGSEVNKLYECYCFVRLVIYIKMKCIL